MFQFDQWWNDPNQHRAKFDSRNFNRDDLKLALHDAYNWGLARALDAAKVEMCMCEPDRPIDVDICEKCQKVILPTEKAGFEYMVYRVKARSFEGRIPGDHTFTIAARNKEDCLKAVKERWPELYDVQVVVLG